MPVIDAAAKAWGATLAQVVAHDAQRWAFSYVATRDVGITQAKVARALGKTNWSVKLYADNAERKKLKEIDELRKAMGGANVLRQAQEVRSGNSRSA
jgi:hypothetical protein